MQHKKLVELRHGTPGIIIQTDTMQGEWAKPVLNVSWEIRSEKWGGSEGNMWSIKHSLILFPSITVPNPTPQQQQSNVSCFFLL